MGIDKKADINEIKKAYKKACLKGDYRHPDKGGDPEKVYCLLKESWDSLNSYFLFINMIFLKWIWISQNILNNSLENITFIITNICKKQFKKLNEAYEVLSNPEKRDVYDKYGLDGLKEGAGGAGGNPFDVFSSFFGGG